MCNQDELRWHVKIELFSRYSNLFGLSLLLIVLHFSFEVLPTLHYAKLSEVM